MKENDGPSFGISGLHRVQSYPTAAANPVLLVHVRTP